ncbi:malonyl CoA-acyl carrier protein transacylase [Clostridia bacterium]|nr:malonyl CoA-acyl carrier protein transacylase [Clostridia bacterium]
MKILLFPGQGTQKPNMHEMLLSAFPDMKWLYDTAQKVLGYDLRELTEENLTHTLFAQPAIMACSLLSFFTKKNLGHIAFKSFGVAGHSLGEYSAMVASEMLSAEDGFRVINYRAQAMEKCASRVGGVMVAVLKLKSEIIEFVVDKIEEGFVAVANYNSPLQTVIAGEKKAVDVACEKLKALGGRIVPLKTEGAFHTKLMQPAADEFAEAIKDISFEPPICPFYSNVTGGRLIDFSNFKELMSRHIVSPVRFLDEIQLWKAKDVTEFEECEPGKILTGLVGKVIEIS